MTKNDKAFEKGSRPEPSREKQAKPESTPPAGNAIQDPANQTRREDMDEDQPGEGIELRGTAPSHEADRSHQPHRDDHRSNQDWGSASQSGKRQGT